MTRILATCCLLLATAFAAAAERVPADSRWILHLDVQAVAKSQVGALIRERLREPEVAARMQLLEAITGLNPERDLTTITLCGSDSSEENGLVLARGAFNADRLAVLARAADGHAEVTVGSRTIHTWRDHDKKAAGCLAAPDLLILGRSADRIRQALTAIDGGATAPIALPAGWDGSAFAVVTAEGLDSWASGPQSAMLQGVRSFAARVSESGADLVLDATASVADANQAQQIVEAGVGLRAVFLMQKQTHLDAALVECLRSARLSSSGSTLVIMAKLPLADAKRLIDQRRKD